MIFWPRYRFNVNTTPQKIHIRPYSPDDLSGLLECWETASRIAHDFLPESFFDSEREKIPAVYLPIAETWVGVIDNRVVGFVALIDNELGAIFVHSDYQRQGVGQAMLEHAIRKREFLELGVFARNRVGRAFYARNGFRETSRHVHEETGFDMLRLSNLQTDSAHPA
jgi:putative acetyltransferase